MIVLKTGRFGAGLIIQKLVVGRAQEAERRIRASDSRKKKKDNGNFPRYLCSPGSLVIAPNGKPLRPIKATFIIESRQE